VRIAARVTARMERSCLVVRHEVCMSAVYAFRGSPCKRPSRHRRRSFIETAEASIHTTAHPARLTIGRKCFLEVFSTPHLCNTADWKGLSHFNDSQLNPPCKWLQAGRFSHQLSAFTLSSSSSRSSRHFCHPYAYFAVRSKSVSQVAKVLPTLSDDTSPHYALTNPKTSAHPPRIRTLDV
jgi:hypothetical protein